MAFSKDDLFEAALAEVDSDFMEEFADEVPETALDSKSLAGLKRKHDEQDSCGHDHLCDLDDDFEDEELSEGFPALVDYSSSEEESDFQHQHGEASEEVVSTSTKRSNERDAIFEAFVDKADERAKNIKQLRPENFKCVSCKAKADLFCKSCIQFYCESCHQTCASVNNHKVLHFCDIFHEGENTLRFASTFQKYEQTLKLETWTSLCTCEGGCSQVGHYEFPRKDTMLTILHSDWSLTRGDPYWCKDCSDPFIALWAYGFLQITDTFAISLVACQNLMHMKGSSFDDIYRGIQEQSQGTSIYFKKALLTQSKYCYLQMKTRLTRKEPGCPCCICPITGEHRPECILTDYSVCVRDSKSSKERADGTVTALVADEADFTKEEAIFAEACKKGGSKSTPQSQATRKKSKPGECKDKFANPNDRVGNKLDIKKILMHCCTHGWILLVALSRAYGERPQYILSTLAKLIRSEKLKVKKFSFDCACKLKKIAEAAAEFVPQAMRDEWLTAFILTLTFGPFHGPNHGIRCFLEMFCKGDKAELIYVLLLEMTFCSLFLVTLSPRIEIVIAKFVPKQAIQFDLRSKWIGETAMEY